MADLLDAAHTRWPRDAGISSLRLGRKKGVGINLAVQDAVAAANILAEPLRSRTVTTETLNRVQKRREFATRMTQRLQIVLQNNIIMPALAHKTERPRAPLFMKAMQLPLLRRVPGRLLALGVRPEHIHSLAA